MELLDRILLLLAICPYLAQCDKTDYATETNAGFVIHQSKGSDRILQSRDKNTLEDLDRLQFKLPFERNLGSIVLAIYARVLHDDVKHSYRSRFRFFPSKLSHLLPL